MPVKGRRVNLTAWQSNVASLTRNLTRKHPHLEASLAILHHSPDKPCPPPCPSCGNRHRPTSRGCPCRVCHTSHKGACPPYRPNEAGRPGCLVCLNVDDATRANAVADMGDGVRSPSLEPGSRSIGTVSTPTERAAETIDHGDALALADAAMERDRVLDHLRLALHERSTQ